MGRLRARLNRYERRLLDARERVDIRLVEIEHDKQMTAIMGDQLEDYLAHASKPVYNQGYTDGYAQGSADVKQKIITMQEIALRSIDNGKRTN